MEIAYLREHPEHFGLVARWTFEEWSDLLEERSVEELRANLERETKAGGVPTTWIALDGRDPIGTVSLIEHDLEIRRELSPWLASLYVIPEWRRRGVARALIAAVIEEARGLGIERLYLYTPGQAPLYRSLGWTDLEEATFRGHSITIMSTLMARPLPSGAGLS